MILVEAGGVMNLSPLAVIQEHQVVQLLHLISKEQLYKLNYRIISVYYIIFDKQIF